MVNGGRNLGQIKEGLDLFWHRAVCLFHSVEMDGEFVKGKRRIRAVGDIRAHGPFKLVEDGSDTRFPIFLLEVIPKLLGGLCGLGFVLDGVMKTKVDVANGFLRVHHELDNEVMIFGIFALIGNLPSGIIIISIPLILVSTLVEVIDKLFRVNSSWRGCLDRKSSALGYEELSHFWFPFLVVGSSVSTGTNADRALDIVGDMICNQQGMSALFATMSSEY